MPIDDLARSDVVTADPETPVSELAATMEAENVGSLVITNGDEPVGIVTDRDLALRVLGDETAAADPTAEDVMSSDLQTVESGDGFYEATRLMAEHGVRRLPVRDGDTLVGIITSDDLSELISGFEPTDFDRAFRDIERADPPTAD